MLEMNKNFPMNQIMKAVQQWHSMNTWDNMIDLTPPFEKPIQSTWDLTQDFYVGLLFADKDELQAVVK